MLHLSDTPPSLEELALGDVRKITMENDQLTSISTAILLISSQHDVLGRLFDADYLCSQKA